MLYSEQQIGHVRDTEVQKERKKRAAAFVTNGSCGVCYATLILK